jgi:hypothetical protein
MPGICSLIDTKRNTKDEIDEPIFESKLKLIDIAEMKYESKIY